jgi:broad specificity phosphatase PhoE/predicted kinase
MNNQKLFIVMVGLPARGKSTVAVKLKENLSKEGVKTRIFNNGNLRRQYIKRNTAHANFYDPEFKEGAVVREHLALINIRRAVRYLERDGQVAILDATNARLERRRTIIDHFHDHPILFIECINDDPEILKAGIERKASLPEFRHLTREEAVATFEKRIQFYKSDYAPLKNERNIIKLDSLNQKIIEERLTDSIPYYDHFRDILVTDHVHNLFLIRHGETQFNLENRIGGDSPLTPNGRRQAERLADYFSRYHLPVIFTSRKQRTGQTAEPIKKRRQNCVMIPLSEFDEIDSGECEGMSYDEIRRTRPEIYNTRKIDKFNYIYPNGEGYVTMRERIYLGIKKALYLSGDSNNVMIIGHRAVNRMILSHFLYRRTEDVPYIYVPQNKFYHIVVVQDKKLFQLKKY